MSDSSSSWPCRPWRSPAASCFCYPSLLPGDTSSPSPCGPASSRAAYLHQNWDEIPARFPGHWNLQGVVDRWSERTVPGVYGPLALSAFVMLAILLGGILLFYGSRRAPQRRTVLKMIVGDMYLVAMIFAWVGLTPLIRLPVAWVIAASLAFALAIVVWSFHLVRDPARPVEVTPDACWHLGSIYYNRHDPALFVQKRVGLGYTLNFGNRLTWGLLAVWAAGTAGMIILFKQ